jgi:formylglycine-generating enzyme required for sulfatase activity
MPWDGIMPTPGKKTHSVAQKDPNAWGLFDMHGNVWEWCADWYGASPKGGEDPAGPSSGSNLRVFRGGSWNLPALLCRSASRAKGVPGSGGYHVGFRLVLLPAKPG